MKSILTGRSARSFLMMGAAGLGALILTAPAFADSDTPVETVVVTGSRIPMSNLTNPSPVSVKDSAAIELTSAATIEDVLKTLPGPDFLGTSSADNNGGIGQSNVSLRGLGTTRTLVLIDGERLVPIYTGTTAVPDLNSVPLAMVERVEVLRDGASSVYGADAIGGVVNIITKTDFSGLQFNVDANAPQHGGGEGYSVSATLGLDMSKGNVTINVTNDFTGAIGQWQRDWSTALTSHGLTGNINRSQLSTLMDASGSGATWYDGIPTTNTDPAVAANVPCTNFVGGKDKLDTSCYTPEGGYNTIEGSLGRTQLSLNGHYDITPDITFILQGTFTDRRSGQQLRPEPLLSNQIATANTTTGAIVWPGFYLPADPIWGYVFNPAAAIQTGGAGHPECPDPLGCILAQDTPIQFGPRTYRQTSETYRARAGFEGTVFNDYHWEVGYVQQRNETTNRVLNTGNFYHLAEATGQLPCVDVPGGCVFSPAFGYDIPIAPPNFYNEPNGLTPAQLAYLKYTQTDQSRSYENYAYADIHGPVYDLPYGTVQGALGVERRFEGLADNPDTLVQLGYAPNFATPTAGSYGVTSVYGELQIPVLKDLPFVKSFDINPSARYDHYSTFGDATTWKVGSEWQVDDNIRFRGTYATGFRAPNVAELFGGTVVSDNAVSGDPCDSRAIGTGGSSALNVNMAPDAATAAARLAPGTACYSALSALGLSPAQIAVYQAAENNLPADQRGVVEGGNPMLQPEKSFGFNIGTVITPTFLPGLSIGGDYYETTVKNAIQSSGGIPLAIGVDSFVTSCYIQQVASYCSAISRNAQGIFQISATNANFGGNHVTGMELEGSYDTAAAGVDLPLIPGSLVIDTTLTREFTNIVLAPPAAGGDIHQTGTYNSGTELNYPSYRSMLNLDWTDEDITVHWDTRYQSGTRNIAGGSGYGSTLPDYFVHSLSIAYNLNGWFGDNTVLKSSRLIFGINNLFDKDPPFANTDGNCKCNTFVGGGYDEAGRSFFLRLTEKM